MCNLVENFIFRLFVCFVCLFVFVLVSICHMFRHSIVDLVEYSIKRSKTFFIFAGSRHNDLNSSRAFFYIRYPLVVGLGNKVFFKKNRFLNQDCIICSLYFDIVYASICHKP